MRGTPSFSKAVVAVSIKIVPIIAQIDRFSHSPFSWAKIHLPAAKNAFDISIERAKLRLLPGPYYLGHIGRVIGDTTSAPLQAAYAV